MSRRYCFALHVFVLSIAAQAADREAYIKGEPVQVGQDWVVLADDTFVEDKVGLTRVLAHATKLPNNPIITADLPWEDYIASPSVVFEAETGTFHMWYQGWNSTAWHSRAWNKAAAGEKKDWYSYWIGYARSRDGVKWEKPLLDLHPYLGFDKTNIVHVGDGGAEAPFVWRNEDRSKAERRFLMTYAGPVRGRGQCLMLAYSADGIHWTIDEEASPLATHVPDGSFQTVLDKRTGQWLLFRRPDYKAGASIAEGNYINVRHNGRYTVSVNRRLGPDWSFPRLVIVPDEEVEWRDIDHMKVFPFGTHYIGLLGMMDDRLKGLQEIRLAVSRDGLQWVRFPYLPPLLPRGAEGAFDAGQIHPAYALDRGEFTYLYYSADLVGQRVQQGYFSSIGIARMRRGRWIGWTTNTDGGYLLTRELAVSGDRLEVNFQGVIAPYMKPIEGKPIGFVRTELLRRSNETGQLLPVPGYSLKESDPLVGDNLSGVVTWKGNSNISSLRGTSLYVRFHVVSSELWGFRFAAKQ